MTAKVFAWPPVSAIGSEWTEIAPIQVSRSMITGAERVSAFQRKRRLASISVPGLGMNHHDGGYMEMLKRYLAGVNLVRLHSYPVAWHLRKPDRIMARGKVFTNIGQTYVEVFGLHPSVDVCRPGDFLTLFIPPAGTTLDDPLPWRNGANPLDWFVDDTSEPDALTWYSGNPDFGTTVQVTQPVISDDTGRAVVPIFETVADFENIHLIFGSRATGVFRPVSYPRAVQPSSGAWSYDWQFREVFADEVGGFLEVNPWAR
jgi:hypothetical protein